MRLMETLLVKLLLLYGVCSAQVCKDQIEEDECIQNEEYCDILEGMHTLCPKTCGICKECSHLDNPANLENSFEMGDHCYIIFREAKTVWQEAKDICEREGFYLASKPDYPIAIRHYIVDTWGNGGRVNNNVWLDARGDGSGYQYLWQVDNSSLPFTDPLFYSSEPAPAEAHGENGCLCIIGSVHHMNLEPNRPYAGCVCHYVSAHPLCEYIWSTDYLE